MRFTLLLLAIVLPFVAHAQTLLSDDFSGGSLNSTLWSTILPTGNSSVAQSGGHVTTTGRGILATADAFAAPYVITGTFTMLSDLEHFNVSFRTDLSASSSYERMGMLVSFSNDGNEVSIQRFTSASDWALLAGATFTLTSGQAYSFSITDTGSDISLSIDGVSVLSATSTYATGGHISFYSREFPSTSTQIDSVTISAIPEPSSYAALLGALCLAAYGALRRHACFPTVHGTDARKDGQ